jgi:uncharacterized protein YecE (DUF72 family)
MARLFCGTSGFAYPKWKPEFYPAKLPSKEFLRYYATRLNSVEINYTFHRLPTTNTLEGWIESTPPEFAFAVKAHQRITHIQRLKESEFTEAFFGAVDPLRTSGRLGPILFQLPPNLKKDAPLLAAFLEKLPSDFRCAFEFRNTSWLDDEVYRLLEQKRVALCLAESDKLEIPEVVTADFVYARLRKSDYAADDRSEIASKAGRFLESGKDLYVFFKHEDTPSGALYAEELLKVRASV